MRAPRREARLVRDGRLIDVGNGQYLTADGRYEVDRVTPRRWLIWQRSPLRLAREARSLGECLDWLRSTDRLP